MSGNGAFDGEMFDRGLSDSEAERLLAGGGDAGPGAHAELAGLLGAAPAALAERLPAEAEAELISRIATEARLAAQARPAAAVPPARRRAPRLGLAAKVLAGAALIPAAFAGLAVAGVHVPEPVGDAFRGVGVELPNQGEGRAAPGSGSSREPTPAAGPAGEQGRSGNAGRADGRGDGAARHRGGKRDRVGANGEPRGPSAQGEQSSGGRAGGRGANPTPGVPRGQGNGPPPHSNAGGNGGGNAGANGGGGASPGGSGGSGGGAGKPPQPPGQSKKG